MRILDEEKCEETNHDTIDYNTVKQSWCGGFL